MARPELSATMAATERADFKIIFINFSQLSSFFIGRRVEPAPPLATEKQITEANLTFLNAIKQSQQGFVTHFVEADA
jgi:hypothetical protein